MRLTDADFVDINNFRNGMLAKLSTEKNSKKPHWSEQNIIDLFKFLKKEMNELQTEVAGVAMGQINFSECKSECYDVANFAFMIWKKIDMLEKKEQ